MSEPTVTVDRVNEFTTWRVHARVNRHEPEIVRYLIDAGMKFFVSTTPTGIGSVKMRGFKRLADAQKHALAQVSREYKTGMAAFKKRTTLYG